VQIFVLGFAASGFADVSPTAISQENGLASELFVPRGNRSSAACAGAYVQSGRGFNSVLDDKLRVSADQLAGALDSRVALTGAVEIRQQDLIINAPALDIEAGTTIAFNQGLRLEQPGLVMQGRRAQWQTDVQQLQIVHAELVLTESGLRAQAEQLTRNAAGQLSISDGEFTYCSPADDGWSLSARQLTVAANSEYVITRGAVLRIKSVPILYLPYLKMPLGSGGESTAARQSGFLVPTAGYDDEEGASLGIPYYLNIAPNFDATLKPKWVGNRGSGFAAQGRWLTPSQTTQVQGGLLANDAIYNGIMSRRRYDQFGGG
jgi:LPS-assembly protein